jgi:hypothetical protein
MSASVGKGGGGAGLCSLLSRRHVKPRDRFSSAVSRIILVVRYVSLRMVHFSDYPYWYERIKCCEAPWASSDSFSINSHGAISD